jgi:hypothetical protein
VLAIAAALTFSACNCGVLDGACNELDAGSNGATCPQTWVAARGLCDSHASCVAGDGECTYPGAGDDTGGCFATAVLLCSALSDGGLAWGCAH